MAFLGAGLKVASGGKGTFRLPHIGQDYGEIVGGLVGSGLL